jgi:GWxTD domain-containing protein
MRNPLRISLWATVVMFSLPQAYSQQASSSDKDHQTAKKQSKQGKKAATELGDTRKEWLEQDAKYIITPAEREAFLKLGTNEERDQFIETFWRNRNPDPESPENSFKEEHYRRIAYANEHFASGVPGWRTDRIQPAERMTGRCGKGAAQRRRMRRNFGVIAVSRNSVTTSNSNLSIQVAPANTT